MYFCVSAAGQRISRDRPIGECFDVEQTLRRPDGTSARIPPAETDEQRSRRLAKEAQRDAEVLQARREAMANKLLVSRFPNQAAHAAKRAEALKPVRAAIQASDSRIQDLEARHAKLMLERQFYPPPLQEPATLTRMVDANDAALTAQRALLSNHMTESSRITVAMDQELAKLRTLWAADRVATATPTGR